MKRTFLPLAAGLLISASAGAGADKVVGGPYVLNATTRSATVMWIVETASASLGASPDKLDRKAGSLHTEKVSFTGLQPGQTYYYDIGQGEAGKGSFRTPPRSGEPFRFLVYGDTRTRHDVHRRVVGEDPGNPAPDFALQTGDMVENGSDQTLWPIFFDIEHDLLRHTAYLPRARQSRAQRQAVLRVLRHDPALLFVQLGQRAFRGARYRRGQRRGYAFRPRGVSGLRRRNGWRRIWRRIRRPRFVSSPGITLR